jgi:hypothetical protein
MTFSPAAGARDIRREKERAEWNGTEARPSWGLVPHEAMRSFFIRHVPA